MLDIIILIMNSTTEVASCYIIKNIKTTEIYANWVNINKGRI